MQVPFWNQLSTSSVGEKIKNKNEIKRKNSQDPLNIAVKVYVLVEYAVLFFTFVRRSFKSTFIV